jgi:molybdopterin synthase catalytic subunit
VIRHPHPGQADLTSDGRSTLRACHRAAGAVDTVEERMLAGISPAHRQQLSAALRACIEALSP